jgi:hypothetical protein
MPTLKQRIESVGTLIKVLVALLALMPGIAVLTGLIDIPPTLVQLVKGLSFFVSIVVLIAILLVSQRIRKLPGTTVAILAGLAVLLGSGAAVGYWMFASRHIVVIQSSGQEGDEETARYVVPLRPSAEMQRLVAPYNGDYAEALETSIQRPRLRQLMEEQAGGSAALMIVWLVLAQTLLVGGIAAGAWRLVMDDEDETVAAAKPAAPAAAPPAAPAPGVGS